MKGEGRVWAFVEDEGELLKAERLYNIVVDKRVLDMLEQTKNVNKKNRLFSIDKRTLELVEKEGLKRNVEGNSSDRLNGCKPENSMIDGKITLSTFNEFRQEFAEGLGEGKQERGLRGNCVSSKLLVRTQQWKKDGALLVRFFN